MIRSALIIGSPDSQIPGVYDDMKNYRSFLKSPGGGAWYENEIVTLESPTRFQLSQHLEHLKASDYSIVVFAGHGEYSSRNQSTMLHLNSNTLIDEDELKVGAPKKTVVIDACRVIAKEPIDEALVKAALATERYLDHLDTSRQTFERQLAACHPGLAVLYGCKIGESAGDIPGTGGRYSSSLLTVALNWAGRFGAQQGSALTVSEAHEAAVPVVQRRSGGSQNPTAEFPRSLPRFPFAVKG